MLRLLPSGRDAQTVIGATIPAAVVDIETTDAEAADADTVAVRANAGRANVDLLEQPFAGGKEMADDGVDQNLGGRNLVVLAEQCLLVRPVFRSGVVDRGLADQLPRNLSTFAGERLFVVPFLVVEQPFALHFLSGSSNGEREHGDEHVSVLALLERGLGKRNLRQVGELPTSRVGAEVPDGLFDTKEVLAHDLTGTLLTRRRLKASVSCVGRQTICELHFGVDAFDCHIGFFAEGNHKMLKRTVSLAGRNFCPLHCTNPFTVSPLM